MSVRSISTKRELIAAKFDTNELELRRERYVNRQIAISQRKNYPISMKFGSLQQQTCNSMTITWRNMKIFKTQDGGQPPHWKSVLAITQQPIARFQRNFARGSIFHRPIPAFHRTYFSCLLNAVWTSVSGGFSYRLRYTCWDTDNENRLQYVKWPSKVTQGQLISGLLLLHVKQTRVKYSSQNNHSVTDEKHYNYGMLSLTCSWSVS